MAFIAVAIAIDDDDGGGGGGDDDDLGHDNLSYSDHQDYL